MTSPKPSNPSSAVYFPFSVIILFCNLGFKSYAPTTPKISTSFLMFSGTILASILLSTAFTSILSYPYFSLLKNCFSVFGIISKFSKLGYFSGTTINRCFSYLSVKLY